MVHIKIFYLLEGKCALVSEDAPTEIELPEVSCVKNISHEQILTIILKELIESGEVLEDKVEVHFELYDDSPTVH